MQTPTRYNKIIALNADLWLGKLPHRAGFLTIKTARQTKREFQAATNSGRGSVTSHQQPINAAPDGVHQLFELQERVLPDGDYFEFLLLHANSTQPSPSCLRPKNTRHRAGEAAPGYQHARRAEPQCQLPPSWYSRAHGVALSLAAGDYHIAAATSRTIVSHNSLQYAAWRF
jgi:hypothetical protein